MKQLEVLDAGNAGHSGDDLFALFVEGLQVLSEQLERELALGPGDRLAHVVFDGLREIPERSGEFGDLAIHRGDQLLFVLMKHGRHCSFGFRSTKYSVLPNPPVSVPSSGRPTSETTLVTSGNEAKMSRACVVKRSPSVRLVLSARVPRAQIAPSSRWGRNSEPMIPLNAKVKRSGDRRPRPRRL